MPLCTHSTSMNCFNSHFLISITNYNFPFLSRDGKMLGLSTGIKFSISSKMDIVPLCFQPSKCSFVGKRRLSVAQITSNMLWLQSLWTTTWSKQYLSAVHPVTCSLLWVRCLFDRLRQSFNFQIFQFRHPDYDPDRAQKLTSSSMSRHLSTRKISSKSMHTFLSDLANRQTDRHRGHIPPLLEVKITGFKYFTSSIMTAPSLLSTDDNNCDIKKWLALYHTLLSNVAAIGTDFVSVFKE